MSTIMITVELKDSEMAGALTELTQALERRGADTAVNWKGTSAVGGTATGNTMSAPQAVSPAEYGKNGSVAGAATGTNTYDPNAWMVSPTGYAKGNASAVGGTATGTNTYDPNAWMVSPTGYAKGNASAVGGTATGNTMSAPQAVSPAEYGKNGGVAGAATGKHASEPLVWSLPGTGSVAAAQEQAAKKDGDPHPRALTFDDIARAAWTLVEAGKGLHFRELLGKFGIQMLTQLPSERFGAFAQALRQLGVKI